MVGDIVKETLIVAIQTLLLISHFLTIQLNPNYISHLWVPPQLLIQVGSIKWELGLKWRWSYTPVTVLMFIKWQTGCHFDVFTFKMK